MKSMSNNPSGRTMFIRMIDFLPHYAPNAQHQSVQQPTLTALCPSLLFFILNSQTIQTIKLLKF